jgi:hypothetical protein
MSSPSLYHITDVSAQLRLLIITDGDLITQLTRYDPSITRPPKTDLFLGPRILTRGPQSQGVQLQSTLSRPSGRAARSLGPR